jgi:hypothetical protein
MRTGIPCHPDKVSDDIRTGIPISCGQAFRPHADKHRAIIWMDHPKVPMVNPVGPSWLAGLSIESLQRLPA